MADQAWSDGTFWSDGTGWAVGPTPVAAVNTDAELTTDTTYLIRVRVENTGGAGATDFRWSYNHNLDGFLPVTTTSTAIKAVPASSFVNDDDVPEVLGGSGTYLVNNNAGTEDGSTTLGAPFPAGGAVEFVLAFQIVHAEVSDGQMGQIRLEGAAPELFEVVNGADNVVNGADNVVHTLGGSADLIAYTETVTYTVNAPEVPPEMTTYFVRNGGSDSASGLSDGAAWATVAKVNAVTLITGDIVQFKRGSVFRGAGIDPNVGGVTYGAYGAGAKPIITGSPDLSNTGIWTHFGNGTWTTPLAEDGAEPPEIMWFDDVRRAEDTVANLQDPITAGLVAPQWAWSSASGGLLYVFTNSTTLRPPQVWSDIQINQLRYGFDNNNTQAGHTVSDIVLRNFRQPVYSEGDNHEFYRVECYRGSRNNFQFNGGNIYLEECVSEDNGLSGAQGAHGYLFSVGAHDCTMFNCTADDNREDNLQLGATCGNNITLDGGTFINAGENSIDIKSGTGHVFRNAFFQNNQSAQQTFNIHVDPAGSAGTTTIEDCLIEQLGSHGALQLVENTSLISRRNTYISRGASAEDCWHIGSLSTGFTTIDSVDDIIWCVNGSGMRIDSGCQIDMSHCTVVAGGRAVDADLDARFGGDLRFEPRNSIFWAGSGNFVMQLVSNGDYAGMDWNLLFRNQALSNNWIGHEVDDTPMGGGADWGSWTGTQVNNGTYQAARAGLDNVVVANPLFVDMANGDFSLQAGSPALNAAEDGSDLGAVQEESNSLSVGVAMGSSFQAVVEGDATERFVSTTGNNGAAGTQAAPWATIAFGLSQLNPGDTLTIRGGRYPGGVTMSTSGTAGNPITIRSFPGEVAIIDVNFAEFQIPDNGQWELDPGSPGGTEVYRSVGTGYGTGTNGRGTFHVNDPSVGPVLSALRQYIDSAQTGLAKLRSTTYTWQSNYLYYGGPGFAFSGGRIYIRLQNLASPRNAGVPAAAEPNSLGDIRNHPPSSGGFDPNDFVINIGNTTNNFTINADHITLSRLAIYGGLNGVKLSNGANNVTIERCRLWGCTSPIDSNDGTNRNCTARWCDIDAGMSPCFSWNEIHTVGTDEHPRMEGKIWRVGSYEDITIEENLIRAAFDGTTGGGSPVDGLRYLRNNIIFIFDDLIQFGGQWINLEVGWNFIGGAGPGYNGGGSDSTAAKFFHHNIMGCRRGEFGWRLGMEANNGGGAAWREGETAFPTHSTGGSITPAKVYNNTIIYGPNNANDGSRIERQGDDGAGVHEALNNICLAVNGHSYTRKVDLVAGEILDYNLMHNIGAYTSGSSHREWGGNHYATLAAWRASVAFENTKSFYAPGLDGNSKQANPNLPAATTSADWDTVDLDYRPSGAGAAASGAKNISATGWPGADNGGYFGAVDPDALTGMGAVGIPAGAQIGPFEADVEATGSAIFGAQLGTTFQGESETAGTVFFGAQLGTTVQGDVESAPGQSLFSGGGAWMDFSWMEAAWMGGASFEASAFSDQIGLGVGLGTTQAAIANMSGAVSVLVRLRDVDTEGISEQIAATTAAASFGTTFAARVNASEAISQAAAFATTQDTLAEFPVDFIANVLFDDARVARAAYHGAFPAATSHAASQTARAAALGEFSADASLNDTHGASNAFSGAFSVATSLAAAQIARAAASGTVLAFISLDDIEDASNEFAGAFAAATLLAAAQVARAAAIEALSASATLDDIEDASNEFAGAFAAAAALDDTQVASVEGTGVVPVSAILASSQVAASAQMATVIDVAAAGVSVTAFSETPTEHVGIVTFALFLPTTQIAEAELDAETSYAASLAATQTAQAAIDAVASYAAAFASVQAERADLDAAATYPAAFASAQIGSSGAGTEIVAATIFDDAQIAEAEISAAASYAAALAAIQTAQAAIDAAAAYAATLVSAQAAEADLDGAAIYPAAFASTEIGASGATLGIIAATMFDADEIAKADLDQTIAVPFVAGSARAAIAIRTGAIAAEIAAATAVAGNARLDGLVPAAVGLDDIELFEADFSGAVVAAAGMDDFEAFSTDVNDTVAAAAAFEVQSDNAADVRDDTIEAVSLGILPEALSESDAVVIVLADFAASVSPASSISTEMTTGDVQMSVAVVGGAQWLGTYLRAKWPNIGVAA